MLDRLCVCECVCREGGANQRVNNREATHSKSEVSSKNACRLFTPPTYQESHIDIITENNNKQTEVTESRPGHTIHYYGLKKKHTGSYIQV